jgi:hypothetical protein
VWAVEEGNIFVWVFLLSMWHLMSCLILIDCLAFHNIKSGTLESIKFKFDGTKADKIGKNSYANHLTAHWCYFFALRYWISLHAERLASTKKKIQLPGTKKKKYF